MSPDILSVSQWIVEDIDCHTNRLKQLAALVTSLKMVAESYPK
jgi:hypothetical protein